MKRGRVRFLATGLLVLAIISPLKSNALAIAPPPESALEALHAGITVAQNEFNPPTISGSDLNSIDSSWDIHLLIPWGYDVPREQGFVGLFRGSFGELDGGVAAFGTNYSFVDGAIPADATTTLHAVFSLAPLGDPATPSGTYTIVVAQKPLTRNLYNDEGEIAGEIGYTDADLVKWFETRGVEGVTPFGYEFLEFNYVAGTPPPPACATDCFSNILFLPGIEASRLYRPQVIGADEKKIWEPTVHDNLHELHMGSSGKSIRPDVYTKENDVIDETPVGANIYKSFIAKMNELKNAGTINDWEAAPYDWRLSLDDILSGGRLADGEIHYVGPSAATSTPYIIQELRRLVATSKSGKVTIIAHSNGGLVAKRLTEVLGPEASSLINKIIFVAVPQVGTPDALEQALHGEPIGSGVIASKSAVRAFASTSPMLYHLLPSAEYFSYVGTPVISFDESLPDWVAKYGSTLNSQETLDAFLTDSFGRVDAETGDVNQPIQLKSDLLAAAETLHSDLDNWTPPAGVQLIQIAGWGVPTTVTGINYKKKNAGVVPEPTFTVDGDGTVVVPSALWTSTTTGAVDYWLDLNDYNRLINRILGARLKTDHASILEVSELLDFLTGKILEQDGAALPQYISSSIPVADPNEVRLRYILHSPLTLDLYDDQGNHTGIATSTGNIEENIPGTYFVQFGDVKYIFADEGTVQHVIMNGYDTGMFTFEVGELQGDTVIRSTIFRDVSVTPQTQVRFDVLSGLGSASDLAVDENGDGTVDSSYASSTGQLIIPLTSLPTSSPPAPISGGGGSIPSLFTHATSVVTTVPTGLVVMLSQKQTTTTSQIRLPAKKFPSSETKQKTTVNAATGQKEQVAAASQSTGSGLWLSAQRWIINKISSLLRRL